MSLKKAVLLTLAGFTIGYLLFNLRKTTYSQNMNNSYQDQKKQRQTTELQLGDQAAETNQPIDLNQKWGSENPEDLANGDPNLLNVYKECFGANESVESEEVFLAKTIAKDHVEKKDLEVENYHLILPSGEERRIHLIPAGKNLSGGIELRYFSLSDSNIPKRITLPSDKTFNPTEEFIESLKKQGEIKFHHKRENLTLKSGAHLIIEVLNEKLREIQYVTKEKSFLCREGRCKCVH